MFGFLGELRAFLGVKIFVCDEVAFVSTSNSKAFSDDF
jgi:hypothetical protein